jgi:arsenite transporter
MASIATSGVQPMNEDVKPTPIDRSDTEKQVSVDDEPRGKASAFASLGLLDRFLAVWIILAMAIGIILGNFVPETGPALQKGKFVGVSVPIGKKLLDHIENSHRYVVINCFQAVGLLVMMYPILCKVQYETLHKVMRHRGLWIQIGFSVGMNWIVAPLLMVCGPSLALADECANHPSSACLGRFFLTRVTCASVLYW